MTTLPFPLSLLLRISRDEQQRIIFQWVFSNDYSLHAANESLQKS
jgi:hypothetical protein